MKNLEHMQNKTKMEKKASPQPREPEAGRRAPQCKAGSQVKRRRPPDKVKNNKIAE